MFININGEEPIQRVYECWFSEQLQDKTRATMLCATTVHFYDQGKTFRRAFIHLSCSRIKTFRWIVPTSSWLEISLRIRRNIVHLDAGSDNSPIKHVQTLSNPFIQDIPILNIAWNSYATSIKSYRKNFVWLNISERNFYSFPCRIKRIGGYWTGMTNRKKGKICRNFANCIGWIQYRL